MKFEGRIYRRNRYLGYRPAREGDKYAGGGITHEAGEQIPLHNVVVFRIKDAPTITIVMDGREQEFYKPNEVSPDAILPLAGHSLTFLALGTPRRKKSSAVFPIRYNIGTEAGRMSGPDEIYIEQPHYLVKDGVVYQWTSRRALDEDENKEAA